MTSLIRRSPFGEIGRRWPADIFDLDLIDRLLPARWLAARWSPRCDLIEKDNEFVVEAELPGVEAKDVELAVSEGMLTIRGEKQTENREEKEGRAYMERYFGSFERCLTLPAAVDETKIEAQLKDGVLEIHLPKVASAAPEVRKIDIKTA
jgi:HSP20 family protein